MVKNVKDLIQAANGGYWYLASPYSHPDPKVREERTKCVHHVLSVLLAQGLYVYSPIWAAHEAAKKHDLPKDHVWWKGFNESFLRPAYGLIIATLDGWRESDGVEWERSFCLSEGNKPCFLQLWDGPVSDGQVFFKTH